MAKTTIASVMTNGQIENAVDKLRSALCKHRSEIASDIAQQVLGVENIGMEMFVPFRKHAEAISNTIVRHVKVNRTRTPEEVLDATGRKQYTDASVVNLMPKGKGEEVEIFFFKVGRYTNDDNLEKEFESRGFKPVDPYSLASVNEADPAFADEHPNGTHWKDANGKWCYTAFSRWNDERYVHVNRNVYGWGDRGWFAGLRK